MAAHEATLLAPTEPVRMALIVATDGTPSVHAFDADQCVIPHAALTYSAVIESVPQAHRRTQFGRAAYWRASAVRTPVRLPATMHARATRLRREEPGYGFGSLA